MTSHGIAAKMFSYLNTWQVKARLHVYTHVQNRSKPHLCIHESVNSKFTKLTQMLVKMPLFDKDSLLIV